jgi:hypothetical protein
MQRLTSVARIGKQSSTFPKQQRPVDDGVGHLAQTNRRANLAEREPRHH